MSSRTYIPRSANTAKVHTTPVKADDGTTRQATVTLYTGWASKGFRSDYKRERYAWVELVVSPPVTGCPARLAWSYSRSNLPTALLDYERIVADITANAT